MASSTWLKTLSTAVKIGICIVLAVGIILDVLSFKSILGHPKIDDEGMLRRHRELNINVSRLEGGLKCSEDVHEKVIKQEDKDPYLLTDGDTDEVFINNKSSNNETLALQIIEDHVMDTSQKLSTGKNNQTKDTDYKLDMVQWVSNQSRGYPLQHISCVTKLAKGFIRRLKSLRSKFLAEAERLEAKTSSSKDDTRFKTINIDDFKLLNSFSQVETLFLNSTLGEVQKCLIPFYGFDEITKVCRSFNNKMKNFSFMDTGKIKKGFGRPRELSQNDLSVKVHQHPGSTDLTLTYVHVISNAGVTSQGHVIHGDLEILQTTCNREKLTQYIPNGNGKFFPEIFTIAQADSDHSPARELTRLMTFMPFLKQHARIKIHISGNMDYARVLSLAKSRFIQGDVRGAIVYVPADTSCRCLHNVFRTQLLSVYLRRSLQNLWPQRDTIVYMEGPKRLIKPACENNEHIGKAIQNIAAINNLNFWSYSEDQDGRLPEVAAMFNRALVILAPRGGDSMNLLFSQPGVVFIESLTRSKDNLEGGSALDFTHSIGGYYYNLRESGHCVNATQLTRIATLFLKHKLK